MTKGEYAVEVRRQSLKAISRPLSDTEGRLMEKIDRDALLAQLAEHPAWGVLKEIMQQNARFQPVNFDEPAWQGKLQHRQAQSEFVIQLIRTVEKAADAIKQRTTVIHE